MKKQISYFGLLVAGLLLAACAQESPTRFSETTQGVYFDYNSSEALTRRVNFAQHVLNPQPYVVDTVAVRLVGLPAPQARNLYFKVSSVKGEALAHIEVEATVMDSGRYVAKVPVRIYRPSALDSVYSASIQVSWGDSTTTIAEKGRFTFRVSESYTEPSNWTYEAGNYFGKWNSEKHVFLIKATKDANYYRAGWDKYPRYSAVAVDSLRRFAQQYPDSSLNFSLPFSSEVSYPRPAYWTAMHTQYLGEYNSASFVSMAQALQVTTANEAAIFMGDAERFKKLNKVAVKVMMERYNQLFNWAYPSAAFRAQIWVPIFEDVDYAPLAPQQWVGASAALIEKYYGSYSAEKYAFLLRSLVQAKGSHNFVLTDLFPVKNDWGKNGTQVGMWDENSGGEDKMRENYSIIRQAYDNATPQPSFTLPEIE